MASFSGLSNSALCVGSVSVAHSRQEWKCLYNPNNDNNSLHFSLIFPPHSVSGAMSEHLYPMLHTTLLYSDINSCKCLHLTKLDGYLTHGLHTDP